MKDRMGIGIGGGRKKKMQRKIARKREGNDGDTKGNVEEIK